MSYIDSDYYMMEYGGGDIDMVAFSRLSKRSSDVINILTGYKITQIGFENLAPFIKDQIKKATAAQVEYLAVNGEGAAIGGGGFGQVSAGNFSYGDKAGKEDISRAETMTSQLVLSLLTPTGLLYRGVGIR